MTVWQIQRHSQSSAAATGIRLLHGHVELSDVPAATNAMCQARRHFTLKHI